MTSLEARLDKASTVSPGCENRGPRLRFFDQLDPPTPANPCQIQEGVHIFSSTRRYKELEDFEEDIQGDVVDGGAVWGRSLVILQMWGWDECFCEDTSSFLGLPPASASV